MVLARRVVVGASSRRRGWCDGWRWPLAGDDGDGAVCSSDEAAEVVRIAGEDLIAVSGQCRDGCIDRVAEASSSEEDAGVAGEREINGNDFHRSEELRESSLSPGGVPPGLRDHDRRRSEL